jgi:hypothetical protein
MSKISESVLTLSEKLSKGITIVVDKDGATTTVAPDLYLANLPEGVTEDQIKAVQGYNSDFFAASVKAFGDSSLDALKKHKSLEEVHGAFPLYGKDMFNVNVSRSETSTTPGTGVPVTKYGVVSAKLVTYDARSNRGAIKAIRDELSASALAAFGEK